MLRAFSHITQIIYSDFLKEHAIKVSVEKDKVSVKTMRVVFQVYDASVIKPGGGMDLVIVQVVRFNIFDAS